MQSGVDRLRQPRSESWSCQGPPGFAHASQTYQEESFPFGEVQDQDSAGSSRSATPHSRFLNASKADPSLCSGFRLRAPAALTRAKRLKL